MSRVIIIRQRWCEQDRANVSVVSYTSSGQATEKARHALLVEWFDQGSYLKLVISCHQPLSPTLIIDFKFTTNVENVAVKASPFFYYNYVGFGGSLIVKQITAKALPLDTTGGPSPSIFLTLALSSKFYLLLKYVSKRRDN